MSAEPKPREAEAPEAAEEARLDFQPEALRAWLARRSPEAAAQEIRLRRISGGQSNPTYFLDLGARALVLRKAPGGGAGLPAAHAVDREFRIMKALAGSGVPVPEMLFLEEDPDLLGAPFYVMGRLEGVVEHDSRLPGRAPEARAAIYAEKARILARLHAVDWKAAGLEGFGRTGPFFPRQIHRWTKQWELSKTREIPEIDHLAIWLRENCDQDEASTIVHGDFRIGNLMLAAQAPRIVGVLDWELSTLGHPLADLAHSLCLWSIGPEEYGGLFGCDLAALGIPEQRAFEEAYLEAAGGGSGLKPFHHAFALFRMAVIFEGIAARALAGTAASENAGVVGGLSVILARRAAEIAAGGRPSL